MDTLFSFSELVAITSLGAMPLALLCLVAWLVYRRIDRPWLPLPWIIAGGFIGTIFGIVGGSLVWWVLKFSDTLNGSIIEVKTFLVSLQVIGAFYGGIFGFLYMCQWKPKAVLLEPGEDEEDKVNEP